MVQSTMAAAKPDEVYVECDRSHKSGHSLFRKSRFAATMGACDAGLALLTPAKDFYLEKLGASPIIMGVLFFAISFIQPLSETLAGRLQNRQALARWFPAQKWGRKAPWLVTHIVLLAVACGCLYVPPSNHPFILHAWFFIVTLCMYWAISNCLIAWESCRQEIYPYNEERAGVEVVVQASTLAGVALAGLPVLVILAHSTLMLRSGASILWCFGILAVGLQAVPIFLEAKSESTTQGADPRPLDDLRIAWRNAACRSLGWVRLLDGLYQGLLFTNLFYYMTYILQLFGMERSLWVVAFGAASVTGNISAYFTGRWLKKKASSYKVLSLVIKLRLVNVFSTVIMFSLPLLMLGSGPLAKTNNGLTAMRWLFLFWAGSNRICLAPFGLWRMGAQCWVVDEDVHANREDGSKREAAFISVLTAAQNFGRASGSAVVFLSYGLTGLQPINCETICNRQDGCLDACMFQSVTGQPGSLRWFIRVIFICGLPLVELLLIYHARQFPIRGIRLARLYNHQAEAVGDRVESGNRDSQMDMLHKKGSLKEVVEAQHSASVVVMPDSPRAGQQHVKQLKSRGRVVSASVIFEPALEALRTAEQVKRAAAASAQQERTAEALAEAVVHEPQSEEEVRLEKILVSL